MATQLNFHPHSFRIGTLYDSMKGYADSFLAFLLRFAQINQIFRDTIFFLHLLLYFLY